MYLELKRNSQDTMHRSMKVSLCNTVSVTMNIPKRSENWKQPRRKYWTWRAWRRCPGLSWGDTLCQSAEREMDAGFSLLSPPYVIQNGVPWIGASHTSSGLPTSMNLI